MQDIIIKNLLSDKEYSSEVISFLSEDFFEGAESIVFQMYKDMLTKYHVIPNQDMFDAEIRTKKLSEGDTIDVKRLVTEALGFERSKTDRSWLLEKTEKWGLERSVYNAIVGGIEEFESDHPDFGETYQKLKEAISYSFDKSIGFSYLEDAEKRYEMYQELEDKFPFGINVLDKVTEGGTEKGTLNLVIAGSGVGKSIHLVDVAAKAIQDGKNVLYVSLEMSEKNILKRIDANLMNIHIAKVADISKEKYLSKIASIQKKTEGEIVVKQYPPRGASAMNIRHLLEELKLKKDFEPDVICVDYLGIMSSATAPNGSNSYTEQKHVAEELRSVAIEYNLPVHSAAQINRDGYDSSNITLANTSDSMGIIHTADLVFSLFVSEEMEESNQAMYTTLKNRYGEVGVSVMVGFNKPLMKVYSIDGTTDIPIDVTAQSDNTMNMLSTRKGQSTMENKIDGFKF